MIFARAISRICAAIAAISWRRNLATLDWRAQFGDEKFDAIFHLASITDTTLHDQFAQVHDNVESFRRLLHFARPNRTRIVYASSAATYGAASGLNSETHDAAPANVYAFSKVIMDNLARRAAADDPDWKIVGLRYFNVYGPREAHKGVPASMIFHLSRQMKAGPAPRIFKHGEQKRDFVYVKDIVQGTLRALEAKESGIYNLGSGQARSFNELIAILNESLGTNFEPEYFDNPHAHYQNHTEADLTNVRKSLGYEPQFSARSRRGGLHEMVVSARVGCHPERSEGIPSARRAHGSNATGILRFFAALGMTQAHFFERAQRPEAL